MRWIKRLLALIAILVLVVIIVAAYLVVTFDANAYKERIESEVREATGRELTLAGPIELTLFPSLGLRLEEVRLGNAAGFGDEPFAELDVVDVAVAVMPLLRRELEVQRVEADGARLNLARDADGRNNWDDLSERAEHARDEAVEGDDRTATESRLAMERINIAGISLSNARVVWDDRQTGMQARLDPFNLRIGSFHPGVETSLTLDAAVQAEGGDLPEPVELALDLNGLMNLDLLNRRYSVRRMRANFGVEGAGLVRPLGLTLESDVALEMAETTSLRFERLSLGLSAVTLTGFAELSGLEGENPNLRTELRTNTFDLRQVLEDLGHEAPTTTDPDVLSRIALDLSASGTPEVMTLDSLVIGIDDTRFIGDARWNASGAQPRLAFTLSGNELDLDRYLPPEAEQARTEGPAGEGEEDIAIELPLEWLRGVDVDGHMELTTLRVLGLRLNAITLEIQARDGDWRIEPLSGTGYDGELTSRLRLDARADTPRYEFAASLADLDIGALLDDFQGDEARLTGTGNLELDLRTAGASVNALTAALNGDGTMRFADGAVRGINIAQLIRRAEARLRGETLEADAPNQTDFSELGGSFSFRDGVVHNDDLHASSPLLRVRGAGSANLVEATLDYRLSTSLVATIEGQGGRSLEDLRGVTLPIRIEGAFTDPSIRLDLEQVLRERLDAEVGERLREERDRLEDEAEERVREEGARLLERLSGSRSRERDAEQVPGPETADPEAAESQALEPGEPGDPTDATEPEAGPDTDAGAAQEQPVEPEQADESGGPVEDMEDALHEGQDR